MTRQRLFYVVRSATPLWRARRGRRETRRFPVTPVRLTPSGSATREISLSGDGSMSRYRRLPYVHHLHP